MPARTTTHAALATVALMLLCALPCQARSRFVAGEYGHEALRLESLSPVTTWEQEGVRVFVLPQGGVLRQGPMRLAAPRMVVWFDRARSEQPDVRAAMVRAYAEGSPSQPVRLVEGQQVRQCGAILMQFSSSLGFTWDCPLVRREEPMETLLLSAAQTRASETADEAMWEEFPPAPPKERAEAVTQLLKAEEVQIFWNETPITVVYIGDVHGAYEDLELRADAAVLWYDPDRDVVEVYARGDVRLYRRAGAPAPSGLAEDEKASVTDIVQFLSADELYVNPTAARGLATNPELRVRDPRAAADLVYVFRGEDAFLVDSKTLTVRKASATTCSFARPHYQFAAERMQVVREEPSTLLTAWDVRFKAGAEQPRSLLWLPFLGTDLTNRAYLLTDYAIGTSSKFGTFVQTTWQPLDLTTTPDWVELWTVNLDYYAARGPAIGTLFEYNISDRPYPRHKGRLRAYYVGDSGEADDDDTPVPQQGRGRVHLEHRTQVDRDWRIDAELYWLSDSSFLDEYFEADLEEEKAPESYLLGRYLRDSTYLALVYKRQVNDFLTQLEETPSADLEIMGLPVGRFVYDGSVMAGHYDQEFNEELVPLPADPPGLWRFHTDHRASLPFNVGIFRVDPFVRALATYVSKSAAVAGSFQGSEGLAGFGGGFTISTTLSRVFGLTSETFDLNRLRHVVIPYVGVDALSVSGDSSDLIQMDMIDTLDSGTEVAFGLRHRLETKRMRRGSWTPINWVELDVAYVSRSSDSVLATLDNDFIRADFEMQLTDHVSLHSRDNRIGLDGQPDIFNVGAGLDYMPRWALEVNYDRITDTNSTISADLNYKLSDRYRLLLFEQYELDSLGAGGDQHLETSIVIRRLLHEWVLDLGLHIEKANDEIALILGFGPAGWGAFKDPHRAAR